MGLFIVYFITLRCVEFVDNVNFAFDILKPNFIDYLRDEASCLPNNFL